MKAENTHIETKVVRVEIIDVDTLARNWWIVLLRGLAGIVFGLITFFAPEISLAALVLVFGAYAFADGVLAIASAIRERGEGRHAAAVTFFWPGITALALLYLIAAWALVTGGFEIAAAIRLRKIITGEWLLALIGVASIALGIMLALFPSAGALAVVIWIGAYALVSGVLLTILAFRLRSWRKSHGLQLNPRTA